MSDKPLHENGWGYDPRSVIHYHEDGPIGTAIQYMGADSRLEVDGEPLANVLGVIATSVVRRQRTAQQAVEDLKVLRDRLPQSGLARFRLDRAIEDMDAPPSRVPEVPPGTPEPLRTLVSGLLAVPLVRKDTSKELDPLLGIISDFAAGRTGGRRMISAVEDLRNRRHESLGDSGKFEIDNAVETAADALGDLPREAIMPPNPGK
jgi:hypothetical protein